MRVDDVAAELGVSKSYAYKIVQKLNAELKGMGYLTVACLLYTSIHELLIQPLKYLV